MDADQTSVAGITEDEEIAAVTGTRNPKHSHPEGAASPGETVANFVRREVITCVGHSGQPFEKNVGGVSTYARGKVLLGASHPGG